MSRLFFVLLRFWTHTSYFCFGGVRSATRRTQYIYRFVFISELYAKNGDQNGRVRPARPGNNPCAFQCGATGCVFCWWWTTPASPVSSAYVVVWVVLMTVGRDARNVRGENYRTVPRSFTRTSLACVQRFHERCLCPRRKRRRWFYAWTTSSSARLANVNKCREANGSDSDA